MSLDVEQLFIIFIFGYFIFLILMLSPFRSQESFSLSVFACSSLNLTCYLEQRLLFSLGSSFCLYRRRSSLGAKVKVLIGRRISSSSLRILDFSFSILRRSLVTLLTLFKKSAFYILPFNLRLLLQEEYEALNKIGSNLLILIIFCQTSGGALHTASRVTLSYLHRQNKNLKFFPNLSKIYNNNSTLSEFMQLIYISPLFSLFIYLIFHWYNEEKWPYFILNQLKGKSQFWKQVYLVNKSRSKSSSSFMHGNIVIIILVKVRSKMTMVKALTEIVSVDIGDSLVSMSVVEKQNESGLKFNERLFIVVHGVFFGYISKVKMSDEPNKINIAEAKVKIPMKSLYSVDVQAEIMTIKFTVQENGKIIPKEWVLKTASQKMATFWKTLMEYQLKMRKSPPKKMISSIQKQKSNQSSSIISHSPQKRESTSPTKVVQLNESKPQKIKQTPKKQLKPQTKVFNNPLFEGDDSDPEQDKKVEKKVKQESSIKKKPIVTIAPIEAAQKVEDKTMRKEQQPQPFIEPMKNTAVAEVKPQKTQKIAQHKKKEPMAPLQLERIEEQAVQETPNVKKQKSLINESRNAQKSFEKKTSEKLQRPTVKKIEQSSKQEQKISQKFDVGAKQSEFINSILVELDKRNEKYPFQQLTYSHEDVSKIVKLYGKDLNEASNEKNKTDKLLTHILQRQKDKMKRSISKLNLPEQTPWIYKQIVLDQSDNLINFSDKCKSLMKILYSQLHNREYYTFTRTKQEKNIVYFEIGDIEIKVPLITYKASSNNSKVSLFDESFEKQIKRQFKYLKYLYKIIKNQGKIRVPYSCVCQYGGIIALFKVKGVLGQKENIMEEIRNDLINLETKSKLPLQKALKNKLKSLKEFYYNELRQGQTNTSFNYCLIDEVQNLFPCDLNDLNPSHERQLRMELVEQESNTTSIPYCTNEDLYYSNNKPELKTLEVLSNSLSIRINEAVNMLNQGSFYFVNPSELTQYLHNRGINIRNLKEIYTKLSDPFIRSLIASEMMSRSIKVFLRKTLQSECFEASETVKSSQDEYHHQLKDKCLDFLNCVFGSGKQTNVIWQLINKNFEQKFQIIYSKEEINKGQLLVSVAYHCNLCLNWSLIQVSQMFKTDQFLKKDSIKEVCIKVKTYEPAQSQIKALIQQRMKEISHENFVYITNKFKLSQQKFPRELQLYPNLTNEIKVFFCNFIEPQQLDWSNNYSQLSIYQSSSLSLYSFKIDLAMIKWYLKANKKHKYLNKFNEFTSKIAAMYGNHHPLLSEMYQLFSQHHKNKGEIQDSINFMKSSLLNYSALFGDNSIQVANSYYNLATLNISFQRWYEAEQYLQKAKLIIDHLRPENSLLEGQIGLSLGLIYFKDEKYKQCLDLISNKAEIFDSYQKSSSNSYELERTQMNQLLYYCQTKRNSKIENIRLSAQLQRKLEFYKHHNNFAEVLWIIIETYLNNITPEAKETMKKLINMIPTKASINFYKKSYDLLQRRYRQKNLFESFKKYTENAIKIVDMIIQKNMLKVWQNLQKVYERETLFDFISLIQELIYFLGRDRLNTI